MVNTEEYEQLLNDFFKTLEQDFHDGLDSGQYRWRQDRYALWSKMGKRKQVRSLEDWFKGELALFLQGLQVGGQITAWDCEDWSQSGRSDFWVEFGQSFPRLYLEVKCLVKGKQGGSKNKTGKPSSVSYTSNVYSVVDDLIKAQKAGYTKNERLYCLLFLYPSATAKEIESVRSSFLGKMTKQGVQVTFSWKEPCYSPSQKSSLSIEKLEVSL